MNKLIRVVLYGIMAVQTIEVVKQWKAWKAAVEDYKVANLKRCNID